jgi:hypothetical protein
MNKSKKSVISTNPKNIRVKKLSGEQSFLRTLDWAKHYVDYKTGTIEYEDVSEQTILAYANYLNTITEEGKYPI